MTEDKRVIVALDAMGGDYAPAEQVKGAVRAIRQEPDFVVKLFGDEVRIAQELHKYEYDN